VPTLVSPVYSVRTQRWFHIDVAYTVVKLAPGTYVNVANYKSDDPQWAGALAVYLGGRVNVVDSTEATALTTAGYTVI